MKLRRSRQMMLLISIILMAVCLAVISLPIAVIAKCALILAFSYYAYHQIEQYVLLKTPQAIVALDCDEHHVWTLTSNNKQQHIMQLLPNAYVSVNWMCLSFRAHKDQPLVKVYLSSDSLSKKDWSLLQLLVRFAKPLA